MKKILTVGLALVFCCLMGCSSCGASEKYAEMKVGDNGRLQVLIWEDVWQGLFTSHGFGGYIHNMYYWSTLSGDGPVYVNPKLNKNGLRSEQYEHRGTITVDQKDKKLIIDLQRIVSKAGEPERLEPSPANGTYRIKKINHDPFLKPE